MWTMKTMKFLMLILPVLISVAFITLLERKILSLIGARQGPNKVSMQGIMQPISDAMKLSNKSVNNLSNFSYTIYYFSAYFMLMMSLCLWSSMYASSSMVMWKMTILVVMLILGVSSMKAIMAGWSTYGKYPLIGSMRTVSQMVSYEAVIYICLLSIIWCIKSFKSEELMLQEVNLMMTLTPVVFMFWMPSVLAELNRTPYDFSEGESELVSGFNTEFGSSSFTMIFLAEYSNIIFFMTLTITLFLTKGSFLWVVFATLVSIYWVLWIRSVLPRMRFDKFMMKAWKLYIPYTTLIFTWLVSKM